MMKEKKLTDSSANYTFNGTGSGDIKIKLTNSVKKPLYIKSITIEYSTFPTKIPLTITDAGYATISSIYALDFTDISDITLFKVKSHENQWAYIEKNQKR